MDLRGELAARGEAGVNSHVLNGCEGISTGMTGHTPSESTPVLELELAESLVSLAGWLYSA